MTKSSFRKKGFILAYGSKEIEPVMVEEEWHGDHSALQTQSFKSTDSVCFRMIRKITDL